MEVKIEDFKTGWYGITVGLKDDQIDKIINALKLLKKSKDHFHFRSNYVGEGGVGDIEFFWMENSSRDNMEIDDSPAIEPNR